MEHTANMLGNVFFPGKMCEAANIICILGNLFIQGIKQARGYYFFFLNFKRYCRHDIKLEAAQSQNVSSSSSSDKIISRLHQ